MHWKYKHLWWMNRVRLPPWISTKLWFIAVYGCFWPFAQIQAPARTPTELTFMSCTNALGHLLRLPSRIPESWYLQGVLMFLNIYADTHSNSQKTYFYKVYWFFAIARTACLKSHKASIYEAYWCFGQLLRLPTWIASKLIFISCTDVFVASCSGPYSNSHKVYIDAHM